MGSHHVILNRGNRMTKTTMRGVFQPSLLAVAVIIATCASNQAHAVDFNIGEIEGKFDSSLSIGASWSAANPDKQFISNFNSQGVTGGEFELQER
jgi:hypothetical protein